MKIYIWLQKVILAVMTCIFLIIAGGNLFQFSQISLSDGSNTPFLFILGMIVCAQLFIVIRALFRVIDYIDRTAPKKQRIVTVLCFVIMTIVFLIFIISMHPRPITDSYDDIDTAAWIVSHGAVLGDNYHIKFVGAYGNNYTLTLIFSFILKVFSFLSLSGILILFFVLNMAAILLSVFFTWLILKECVHIRTANKVLILCVLNPLYYCLVFWIYSLTFSLPVMMGIIYTAVKIYQCESKWKEIVLGILMGGLVVAGYELRPTTVFPVIAMVITTPVLIYKHKMFKKIFLTGVVTLLSAVMMYSVISMVKEHYFGEIQGKNFPLVFWLSMGSHGTGDLESNKDAWNIIVEHPDVDEQAEIFRNETIENYKELGVSGTVGLWMKKTVITWSDGYSTLNNRLSHGEINSYLYELIGGTHRQFFEIYCQAYRFLIIFGIILFCLQQLGAQKFSVLYFTMLVTLAGGIAFYMIWEAKDIYSAAFLLPMFILAQEGLGQTVEKEIPVPALSAKRRFINNILIVMIAVVFLCGDYMCRTKATFNYYRINTMYNSRESDPIEMTGSLCQDFYVEKAFNRITLMAGIDEEEGIISDYTISILDSNKRLLAEKNVKADDIKKRRITLDFDKIQCDNHYYLTIRKNQTSYGDIHFYIRNTYFLDSYRGQLIVDGAGDFVNDLNMDVSYSVKQPYFTFGRRMLFNGTYAVISILCFVYILKEQKAVERERQETRR